MNLVNGSGGNLLANWTDGSVNLKVLNLTLFLEELYNGDRTMRAARNATGPQWGANIADKIVVELHSASSTHYSDIIYTSPLTELSTSGQATIVIPTNLIGSYYITIKHRNSIETTTAAPVSFEGCVIFYDFSTSASQAFGDNMRDMGEIPGVFAIYCGDFASSYLDEFGDWHLIQVQDGTVDDSDIYYAYSTYGEGYLAADVNGDGKVNDSDVDIISANSNLPVYMQIPY